MFKSSLYKASRLSHRATLSTRHSLTPLWLRKQRPWEQLQSLRLPLSSSFGPELQRLFVAEEGGGHLLQLTQCSCQSQGPLVKKHDTLQIESWLSHTWSQNYTLMCFQVKEAVPSLLCFSWFELDILSLASERFWPTWTLTSGCKVSAYRVAKCVSLHTEPSSS